MHAFSAADVISPAIRRTKWFLFEPFRWSTFLKLCLVGVLTEGGGSYGSFNVPGGGGGHHGGSTASPAIPTITSPNFGLSPMEIALIAGAVVFLIGIGLVISYLITRLRFALFHCLVYQTREIRPGWRIYESQSWRYFLLTLAVGLVFLFAVLVVIAPFILGFYRMYQSTQAGESLNVPQLLGLLLPLIPIFILIVLVGIAMHIILRDLMLPHMALENASAGEAWRQVRTRIMSEKGGFALYALLRLVLPIAAGILAFIVMLIPAIVLVVVLAVPIAGLAAGVASASGLSKLIFILLIAAIAIVGVALVILLAICIGGPIGIGVRNYALLFYGGRYQVLGDLLSPPPSPVVQNAPGTA